MADPRHGGCRRIEPGRPIGADAHRGQAETRTTSDESGTGTRHDRQPILTDRHIATPTGVAKAQQSRPSQTCGAPTEQLNSSVVGIKGKARHTPGGGVA